MIRPRTKSLAPPPPSPEMADSPAYCALSEPAKALLLLIEIEVQVQGGMLAAMLVDDLVAATGMRRSALDAALDQLAAAGFVNIAERGKLFVVALSPAWRRT